jgi:DNA-binding response OmpR family regulator
VAARQDPIIERLVREGFLGGLTVGDLLERHRALSLASLCWVHGLVDEAVLAGVLADHHAHEAIVFERSVFSLASFARLSEAQLSCDEVLPVAEDDDAVHVVVDRPHHAGEALAAIARLFGKPPMVRVGLAVALSRTIRACAVALARGEAWFVGPLASTTEPNLCVVEPRTLAPGLVGEITQSMALGELMDLDITAESLLDDGQRLVEAFAQGVRRIPGSARRTARVSEGGSTAGDGSATYTPAQPSEIGEDTSQVVLELDASPGPHYGRGHGEKARVVVVDDDLAARQLLCRMLVPEGYEVIEVGTAHAAIDVIRQRPPDLVISDVMLPDLGGFQLCRAIKESRKYGGIAVVLVSAVIDSERVDDEVLALYGVDGYFEKPLDKAPFQRRVRALLVERGAAPLPGSDAFERALALYRAGKLDEAVVALAPGIEAEPQSLRYQLLHANLLYKQGRHPEAMDAYEAVLNLRPDYFPALNRLAYLYHRAGLPTKAVEAWSRALPICPDPRVREMIEGVVRKLALALAR